MRAGGRGLGEGLLGTDPVAAVKGEAIQSVSQKLRWGVGNTVVKSISERTGRPGFHGNGSVCGKPGTPGSPGL